MIPGMMAGAIRRRNSGDLLLPETDPYFANVIAGLHFDGVNNGTSFPDVTGLVWTREGSVITSTAQSKFGGASGYFGAFTDQWGLVNSSSISAFGTGDFTIEAFVFVPSGSTDTSVISSNANTTAGTSSGWAFYSRHAGFSYVARFFDASSGGVSVNGSTEVTVNTWHHLAVTRQSGTIRIWLDGVLDGEGANTSNFSDYTYHRVGSPRGDSPLLQNTEGYLEDYRETKGVARWSSGFTPRTTAFPDS